ncbi:hypothetical protein D3C81_2091200 [compost metagenome]
MPARRALRDNPLAVVATLHPGFKQPSACRPRFADLIDVSLGDRRHRLYFQFFQRLAGQIVNDVINSVLGVINRRLKDGRVQFVRFKQADP